MALLTVQAMRLADPRTVALQEQSTRLVTSTACDPKQDIINERAKGSINVPELQQYLHGGREKIEKRRQFAEVLAKTSWGDKSKRYSMSREEEYVCALKGALGIWQKMRRENLSVEDGLIMRSLMDFPSGLELHIGMFIPTLLGQGDPEQQAKWLPMAYKLQIVGTYAQTEMGHGTFIRGLETTATYDPEAQEFIIHSPTLSSTKWWPGGMGKTATHAVVMARLIVRGKDYGPHAFIVQLRSLTDHRPVPGITVGDIGHKFGFGSVDNGYLRMEYIRIPRENMLMRFSRVTPEGEYVPPPPANARASYATMVYVRADIVRNAGTVLQKAVTIAVRFAAVRRQTTFDPKVSELQVLDYQNCAAALLPLVAAAYSLTFMGRSMFEMYTQFERDRDQGSFAILPELHALSSGLKALCTATTADGIELCRRTCGGHGFSKLSGLPSLYQSYVQNVTWEGENNVLYLQTARYLLKNLAMVAGGKKVSGSAAYLNSLQAELAARCPAKGHACWSDPAIYLGALRHRASRLGVQAAELLQSKGATGKAFEGPVWNGSTVELIRLAQAHAAYCLQKNFVECIERVAGANQLRAPTVAVMRQLAALSSLQLIEADMGDFLEDGYLAGDQAGMVRQRHRALLLELRPNAVSLVDSFGMTDYDLNSAIGRADGDIYTALMEAAAASPLNATQEGPAWEEVLKPVMLAQPPPRL